MKTLIKIDRESIKLNPEGGNTYTIIRSNKEVFVNGTNSIPSILNEDNFMLIRKGMSTSPVRSEWGGILLDESLIPMLERMNIEVEIKYNHHKIQHAPLPKYLYKYENVQLQCNMCFEHFMLKELECNSDDDGNYSDTICPICGRYDCVDIEYEKIENIKI